ncbi:Na/Pi cotransporter family protein [Aquimarina algicola]|uniref:Na/Pi cotransporter family protein n=2 Tax=Aquimarina algicola TaxID=2589995 RepID=A0A504JFS2_9FLAO|nr:Na/Pi cotransporter family protein [Aquimarina algicola]
MMIETMSEVIPLLIGGVVLFLYAITQLSAVMNDIFTEKAKDVITKYTSTIFSTILIGTILTILLDSSSAVIILVIVFINAKTLSFRQAIGIIMGANIGTTISSQIIAMDVGKYAVIPLIIGLLFEVFIKNKKWKKYGNVLLYFGMLFFGLFIIETSVLPMKDSKLFSEWIVKIEENYIQGALIGGLITLIIQSSSGTVGMAIVLGKQQVLSTAAGIAIMLGAELGTCSDTLLATIKGSRQALKAGVFHLLFNFFTIIIGLLLFVPFVRLVQFISKHQDIGSQIANAHVLFNVLGVLLFIPIVGVMEKLLNIILPDRELNLAKA